MQAMAGPIAAVRGGGRRTRATRTGRLLRPGPAHSGRCCELATCCRLAAFRKKYWRPAFAGRQNQTQGVEVRLGQRQSAWQIKGGTLHLRHDDEGGETQRTVVAESSICSHTDHGKQEVCPT